MAFLFYIALILFLSLHSVASKSLEKECFYSILNVKKNASNNDIKKAYRKMSLKHHPDQGGKKEDFMEISDAYDVLSNEESRRIYDKYGREGIQQYKKQGGKKSNKKGNIYSEFTSDKDYQKAENTNVRLSVTLEQLLLGDTIEVSLKLNSLCLKCFGLGARSEKDISPCNKCDGSGSIPMYIRYNPMFVMKTETKCDACNGEGKIIKKKCGACKGKKLVPTERKVSVAIEKGMQPGEKIVLDNEGAESLKRNPGDLVFTLSLKPHPVFKKIGNDLHFERKISLIESLVGFEFTMDGLSGEKLDLFGKGVTKPGSIQRIRNKGMYSKGGRQRGDVVVKYFVEFPKELTPEQISKLSEVNL